MSRMTPEQSHRYYEERKYASTVLHRCFKCGEQDAFTLNGRRFCADCIYEINEKHRAAYARNPDRVNAYGRKHRQKMISERRCAACGKPLPESERHKNCAACRAKQAARFIERTGGLKMRTENGLCYRCQKNPIMEGRTICESCYEVLCEHVRRLKEQGKFLGSLEGK